MNVEAKGYAQKFRYSSKLLLVSVTGSGELRRFKLNRMNNNKMFKFL